MPGEDLLQSIWKSARFLNRDLRTRHGERIRVIRQGEQNLNAGPDFFNAMIRIGSVTWAGNVEVHCRASDWYKHGHHLDPAYDNVILHVVHEEDGPVCNSRGRAIPALEIRVPANIARLEDLQEGVLCWQTGLFSHLHVPLTRMQQWFTILQAERLERKSNRILSLVRHHDRDWERALYFSLGSGFGLPLNSLPFEMTLNRVPYPLILQHRDSVEALEAILFGQAGFLDPATGRGPYASSLYRQFLQHSHVLQLPPLEKHLWKLLRLRPASFPSVRIAQFAFLAHKRFPMLEPLLEARSLAQFEQLLKTRAGEYWNTHYRFGLGSPESVKHLGQEAVRSLLINAIVPFLMAFGKESKDPRVIRQATMMVHELEAESNHIMRKWAALGIVPRNAFESQALIQLHEGYCKQKRCLDCQIGMFFIERTLGEK